MRFQEKKKRIYKKCCICDNDDYNVLDCHRIIPGSQYNEWGTLVCCSNCHRKIHSNEIEIIGKYHSTAGITINYKENGVDKWKNI